MSAIRLLIVDDHPVVRDGLRGMFAGAAGFEVMGEASDGAEVLAASLHPGVILIDPRLPAIDGATAIGQLAKRGIPARVLVLTTYDSDNDVAPATATGATGYLPKDSSRKLSSNAIKQRSNGICYVFNEHSHKRPRGHTTSVTYGLLSQNAGLVDHECRQKQERIQQL